MSGDRIEELKQTARETEWVRTTKPFDKEHEDVRRLWHRTYDELEKLMDDDDFEDFLDDLDGIA